MWGGKGEEGEGEVGMEDPSPPSQGWEIVEN